MTVFVDTSAFLAVLNREDRFHPTASKQWRQLVHGEEQLICNNYVLVETIALLQGRFGLEAVQALEENALRLVATYWLNEADHREALTMMLAANRRQLSLVDCSAMVTMRSLGIKRIFTFDTDFDDYRFERLPQRN